jgi:hypothetical protein
MHTCACEGVAPAVQVSELKRALAGSERGVVATLVREAAAPLHEQEAEAQGLRAEVERQKARVAEVRTRRQPPAATRSTRCAGARLTMQMAAATGSLRLSSRLAHHGC